MKELRNSVKVYLDDTDAQGIVYHANYLKYCERSRTDLLEGNGYTLGGMQELGTFFVVHEMRLRFLAPAKLHDVLVVHTRAARGSDYRLNFQHEIFREWEAEPLFKAEAVVVAIDGERDLIPLPEDLLPD